MHNVVWDAEECCFVEEIPEGELSDCMQNNHRWHKAIPYRFCTMCGKIEELEPDFATGDVRNVH